MLKEGKLHGSRVGFNNPTKVCVSFFRILSTLATTSRPLATYQLLKFMGVEKGCCLGGEGRDPRRVVSNQCAFGRHEDMDSSPSVFPPAGRNCATNKVPGAFGGLPAPL